jgi:hypothetical protein
MPRRGASRSTRFRSTLVRVAPALDVDDSKAGGRRDRKLAVVGERRTAYGMRCRDVQQVEAASEVLRCVLPRQRAGVPEDILEDYRERDNKFTGKIAKVTVELK